MIEILRRAVASIAVAAATSSVTFAHAQAPSSDAKPDVKSLPLTLESLAWLEGCWRGSVNQREFREYWLPLRGGMIVGAGHTVFQDKTQDFEYMRVEARPDGVFYVVVPSGKQEAAFKLTSIRSDEQATEFTFAREGTEFPDRIVYLRGQDGWLYATAQGPLNGEDRRVTYPMRRITCESGELIRK